MDIRDLPIDEPLPISLVVVPQQPLKRRTKLSPSELAIAKSIAPPPASAQ